jgi:hypothetical protein
MSCLGSIIVTLDIIYIGLLIYAKRVGRTHTDTWHHRDTQGVKSDDFLAVMATVIHSENI